MEKCWPFVGADRRIFPKLALNTQRSRIERRTASRNIRIGVEQARVLCIICENFPHTPRLTLLSTTQTQYCIIYILYTLNESGCWVAACAVRSCARWSNIAGGFFSGRGRGLHNEKACDDPRGSHSWLIPSTRSDMHHTRDRFNWKCGPLKCVVDKSRVELERRRRHERTARDRDGTQTKTKRDTPHARHAQSAALRAE